MVACSILLDLPEATAREILSTWLNLWDICRMDSAYCDKSTRQDYLFLAYSQEAPYTLLADWGRQEQTNVTLRWALKKGAHFSNLIATDRFLTNDKFRKTSLAISGSSVRSLTLFGVVSRI